MINDIKYASVPEKERYYVLYKADQTVIDYLEDHLGRGLRTNYDDDINFEEVFLNVKEISWIYIFRNDMLPSVVVIVLRDAQTEVKFRLLAKHHYRIEGKSVVRI